MVCASHLQHVGMRIGTRVVFSPTSMNRVAYGWLLSQVGAQGSMQRLLVIDKHPDGTVEKQETMSVMYVPLVKQ